MSTTPGGLPIPRDVAERIARDPSVLDQHLPRPVVDQRTEQQKVSDRQLAEATSEEKHLFGTVEDPHTGDVKIIDAQHDPHEPGEIPDDVWQSLSARARELQATAHERPQERVWNKAFLIIGLIGEWHFARLLGVPFDVGKLYDGGRDFGDVDVKSVPYFDRPLLNRLVADPFKAKRYALCAVDVPSRRVRYVGWATREELQAAPVFDYRFGDTHTLDERSLRRGMPV